MATNESRWSSMAVIALVTAIGTCLIAVSSILQWQAMDSSVEVLKNQLRVSQKPNILLSLNPSVNSNGMVQYSPTDEVGGQRWTMLYYATNIGFNPAYNLRYYHDLSIQSEIEHPIASKFEKVHNDKTIWPGNLLGCGADVILRQKANDHFGKKDTLYRHFYIIYDDELGNTYRSKAKWQFSNYEEGQPLDFILLESRNLSEWDEK